MVGLGELADKTTIANVVAAVLAIGGLVVLALGHDYSSIKFLVSAAVGYLFGASRKG